MPTLFEPLRIGELDLPNRVIMSALTRMRADADGVPTPIMVEYYRQRATAGLMLTEATAIEPLGVGVPNATGIWTDAHIAGWRRVTDAVHEAGGRIFCQLQHVGNKSHQSYLGGELPVAPSAVSALGTVPFVRPKQPYPVPRVLTETEAGDVATSFARGARNAIAAGFDGVSLHAAHGYLLDLFLQDSTNLRTDRYGGSREARARLVLEAVDAASEAIGAGRVAINISPRGIPSAMPGSDPVGTFSYLAGELGRRNLAFLFIRGALDLEDGLAETLRSAFAGPIIINEGMTRARADDALVRGVCDAVGFGRYFIGNPDLVRRLRSGAPLAEANEATFYAPGPEGYIDYPTLDEDAYEACSG